jgi:hypothetical protein
VHGADAFLKSDVVSEISERPLTVGGGVRGLHGHMRNDEGVRITDSQNICIIEVSDFKVKPLDSFD